MKKYTNKILIITLIAAALMMVVIVTVEVRKAFHRGEIKTNKEWVITHAKDTSDMQLGLDILDSISKNEK